MRSKPRLSPAGVQRAPIPARIKCGESRPGSATADLEERLQIIRILGQMDDTRTLATLRERMSPSNKGLRELTLSVCGLKCRLGVE